MLLNVFKSYGSVLQTDTLFAGTFNLQEFSENRINLILYHV